MRDGAVYSAREKSGSSQSCSAQAGKFAGNTSRDLSSCHVDVQYGNTNTRTADGKITRTSQQLRGCFEEMPPCS